MLQDTQTTTINMQITGMHCTECAKRLEKSLLGHAQIHSASVSFPLERATVQLNPLLSLQSLAALVRKTGYDVATTTHQFQIEQPDNSGDGTQPIDALQSICGVQDVVFQPSTSSVQVTVFPLVLTRSRLIAKAAEAGVALSDLPSAFAPNLLEWIHQSWDWLCLILAALLTTPFLIDMVLHRFGWQALSETVFSGWVQGILATGVLVLPGAQFFKGAWFALKEKTANMDVLVALGATSACGFSWVQLLLSSSSNPPSLYFGTPAFIITFVLVGKHLEQRAKHSIGASIQELLARQPETILCLDPEGSFIEAALDKVQVGDVLLCKTGSSVPVDGVIKSGKAEIDESVITGESIPVVKETGDRVYTGSTIANGFVQIEAQMVGEQSTLAQIVRRVEEAQAKKAEIFPLVDKVCHFFVPGALCVAVLAFLGWLLVGSSLEISLINAVSVLVIACPCALGLATPTALMAGISVAARNGILFRDNKVLQKAHELDLVAFDKSGTLTTSKPALVSVDPATEELSATDLLQIAASLQQGSDHPLAQAIAEASVDQNVPVLPMDEFRSHIGQGVEGLVHGSRYYLGNQSLINAIGLPVNKPAGESTPGQVMLVQEVNNTLALLGSFVFEDELRPTSIEAIDLVKQMNIRTVLLSGDITQAVSELAQKTGMDTFISCATPEQKVTYIENEIRSGHHVGMVGDGINDAMGLARAHVGFALHSGTDTAIASSGVVLMRPDLKMVAHAINISKRTFRKIRQNLFWAFFYNVVALPLAAFGYLNPGLAAAAMAFSSFSVVVNSLLLKLWKPGVAPIWHTVPDSS